MKNIVDMIIEAYIEVHGARKWNSLTAKEQHDVIMTIVRDLNSRLEQSVGADKPKAEYDPTGAEWYQEEKKQYGCNGPVYAYDNYTGSCDGEFDSYDAFRKALPSAEITMHKMLEPGKGCIIYC